MPSNRRPGVGAAFFVTDCAHDPSVPAAPVTKAATMLTIQGHVFGSFDGDVVPCWSSSRIHGTDSCGVVVAFDSGSLDLGAAPDAERAGLLCHRFPSTVMEQVTVVEVAVVDRCRGQREVVQATAETELLSPVAGRVHHDRSLIIEVAVPNVDRLVRGDSKTTMLIVCGRWPASTGFSRSVGFVDDLLTTPTHVMQISRPMAEDVPAIAVLGGLRLACFGDTDGGKGQPDDHQGQAVTPTSGMNENTNPTSPRTNPAVPRLLRGVVEGS